MNAALLLLRDATRLGIGNPPTASTASDTCASAARPADVSPSAAARRIEPARHLAVLQGVDQPVDNLAVCARLGARSILVSGAPSAAQHGGERYFSAPSVIRTSRPAASTSVFPVSISGVEKPGIQPMIPRSLNHRNQRRRRCPRPRRSRHRGCRRRQASSRRRPPHRRQVPHRTRDVVASRCPSRKTEYRRRRNRAVDQRTPCGEPKTDVFAHICSCSFPPRDFRTHAQCGKHRRMEQPVEDARKR